MLTCLSGIWLSLHLRNLIHLRFLFSPHELWDGFKSYVLKMILFDGFGSFQRETENLACHQKWEVLSKWDIYTIYEGYEWNLFYWVLHFLEMQLTIMIRNQWFSVFLSVKSREKHSKCEFKCILYRDCWWFSMRKYGFKNWFVIKWPGR